MGTLRTLMSEAMQLRRFSPKTQEAYLSAVAGLANHYHQSPDRIAPAEVRDYLLHLTVERGLSWSSCNVAVSAFRFLYVEVLGRDRAELPIPPRQKPAKLPEILSRQELERLFACAAAPKHRALLRTTYAAGLRVSEVVRLKVSDLDSERMLIRVEQGKGMKDRYTLLSPQLLEELRLYWRLYRPPLWLFPSTDPQRQLHIGRAQKVYYQAKARAGITKGGGIHTLRHCFATHLLEAGVDLRTIQSLMGHTSITTTMRYLQVRRQLLDSRQQLMDLLAFPKSGAPDFVGDHGHATRLATTGGSDRLTAAAKV
jgi:integrase/recombinase XerD